MKFPMGSKLSDRLPPKFDLQARVRVINGTDIGTVCGCKLELKNKVGFDLSDAMFADWAYYVKWDQFSPRYAIEAISWILEAELEPAP